MKEMERHHVFVQRKNEWHVYLAAKGYILLKKQPSAKSLASVCCCFKGKHN